MSQDNDDAKDKKLTNPAEMVIQELGGDEKKKGKTLNFNEKKVEQELSKINSKIADASDIALCITELSEKQEDILEDAQKRTAELYEQLEDLQ